jgi:hypothetical protein
MRILLICVLLFSFGVLYGQKTRETKSAPSSTSRAKKFQSPKSVEQLLDDAEDLEEKSPSEALEIVKEALARSISSRDRLSEGRCYILLGRINIDIQEWKLAVENFSTAYKTLESDYPSSEEIKQSLQGLGESNLKLGDFDASLKYFQQLLKMELAQRERAERLLDVSEVHYQMKNYSDALAVLEGIRYNPKVRDTDLESRIESQKAKIYAQTNQLEKAAQRYESSQDLRRSNAGVAAQKDDADLQSTKEQISEALSEQERYDEEISLRNNSIQYNLESKNLSEVSKDKVELSKALVAKGERSAAIKELEEAALIADTINDPKKQSIAFLSLATIYEENGNNAQALRTYRKYSDAVTRAEKQKESRLLEKSALIKQQRDIEEVAKYIAIAQQEEAITEAMVSRQRLVIYGLILIILIIAVTSYFIYKNAIASKRANQLLALKSLRSQMNPHFIFNALNSLNHFVAEADERTANKFLSEFSRLMRLVLENSQQDFIPLYKEEEIISLYLKLEHYRFREKFDYSISIDNNINKEAVYIPPMLIQPYIENAVWHGLRYKESKGHLNLSIRQTDHKLEVEIKDDGIGRKRSTELKTENQKKHNSTGLKNIRERLKIINKIYRSDYKVLIEDLAEGTGTKVILELPLNNKLNLHA